MGYTTEFEGAFTLSKNLTDVQARELIRFSEERHGGGMDPFPGFPGFWCDWAPVKNEKGEWALLAWNGTEKFYDYVDWLEQLCQRFFTPWGITVSGQVEFQGEDSHDRGVILAKESTFTVNREPPGCHRHH